MDAHLLSQSTDFCRGRPKKDGEKQRRILVLFPACEDETNVLYLQHRKGGAIMKMKLEQDHERKEGLLQDGVHRTTNREVVEHFVAQLSDEEIILLDALLSSLG